jgi:hypothetical protein
VSGFGFEVLERAGFMLKKQLILLIFLVIFAACRQNLAPVIQLTEAEKMAKLKSCTPDYQPDSKIKLSVSEIWSEGNQTKARVVFTAPPEAAEFYLPQYLMSRGRWLMNERWRAYIRDENCKEVKLQDRTPQSADKIPDSGLIKLKANEKYEVILSFAKLPEESSKGILVYGQWVLPVALKAN